MRHTRIAMRTGTDDPKWLLADHLGSRSKVANFNGLEPPPQPVQLYMAFGESRYTSGSMPTRYQFTGQFNQSEIGLYFYGSRWYDASLGRWAQADTIVPDMYNPLDYDRYAYVRNNPLKYTDPTGHAIGGDKKEDLFYWNPRDEIEKAKYRRTVAMLNTIFGAGWEYVIKDGQVLYVNKDLGAAYWSVDLTREEAQDLIAEITWYIHNPIELFSVALDLETLLDIVKYFGLVITFFGQLEGLAPFLVGLP